MGRPKLSDLELIARKRLRRIDPDGAGRVTSKDIYWTVPFLEAFLARCDELAFEDPQAAYRMAYHAPSLAGLIGVGNRPGEYTSETIKRSFRVLALAVFASTCRRVGKLSEAETQYHLAFEFAEQRKILPLAKAELFCRYGSLQARSSAPDTLIYYEQALNLFSGIGDASGIAQTLVLRAGWYWSIGNRQKSALDLSRAIAEAGHLKDPRAERATIAALGNLARVIADGFTCQDATPVVQLISVARRKLSKQVRSVTKLKLIWIEGTLNRSIFFYRHAIRLLNRAREGFRSLELAPEFALISLELAIAMFENGDLEALEQLRTDTITVMSRLTDDQQLLTCLESWCVRMHEDGLLQLQQTVSDRIS